MITVILWEAARLAFSLRASRANFNSCFFNCETETVTQSFGTHFGNSTILVHSSQINFSRNFRTYRFGTFGLYSRDSQQIRKNWFSWRQLCLKSQPWNLSKKKLTTPRECCSQNGFNFVLTLLGLFVRKIVSDYPEEQFAFLISPSLIPKNPLW